MKINTIRRCFDQIINVDGKKHKGKIDYYTLESLFQNLEIRDTLNEEWEKCDECGDYGREESYVIPEKYISIFKQLLEL